MQFMLMCSFDETRWNALPERERDTIMDAYRQWVDRFAASGHHVGGGKLDDSATARTVRHASGKAAVTDGPFAETREQIGGFHIIECRDQDEAVRIAQEIPTLPAGGAVEVRPLLYSLHN